MAECRHAVLELLPARKRALRCRHCHLTLSAEEAGDGHCPECFERSGERYRDFDEMVFGNDAVSYRCEECGVIIKCG